MTHATLNENNVFHITVPEVSLLQIWSPNPVLVIDKAGCVFVYTKDGEKLDTGVVMGLPLPEGQQAMYEVMRALGIRCARPLSCTAT